jgi:hypothetical protein
MRSILSIRSGWVALLLLAMVCGCDRAKPPEPVAIGDVARVLREAFAGTQGDVKGLVDGVVAAVGKRDWPRASMSVQALANHAGLTRKQDQEVARCLIAINTELSQAAESGDAQAEQLRQYRRMDK